MSIPFELIEEEIKLQPNIKVIGVGGAGGNAVANMIRNKLSGVEFVVANTDYKVLELNPAPIKIQLGKKLTNGMGAGGKPEIGKRAAEESEKEIRDVLKDADMVFIAAGMGGGTGTGAAPVIANICKELGILTVAVVTKPFSFEGRHRIKIAEEGLAELSQFVDTLITIPNDRLLTLGSPHERLAEMFKKADDVLYYAVRGISDLILSPGYINLDFADVKAVMSDSGGMALMGMGEAAGEGRAEIATQMAVYSPLLEDVSISRAKGVLLNISVNPENFTIHETQIITSMISKEIHPDAKVYLGVVFDESLGEVLRVTVIATGLESTKKEEKNGKVVNIEEGVKRREEREKVAKLEEDSLEDTDVLDIPTFLRRNAD
ncbi:cell division protein FtsZ [Thermodesulfobacterium sp.]|jgi:cell division protein FtsZ|uniref:cell division protein FtsZ n=1 Tax=Thermodesulfobacterium sp. TaxID=1965289 RepID=UPI00257A4675|nr:cell division protein FtsZ [Thermodesulfobacterium sp.]MBZ4682288.1 cell division protein FtsZ [Thermodesulfobacterium sp.]MDN5380091.1 cell division protein FtsZ [Thermodesulfobacterium sp.]